MFRFITLVLVLVSNTSLAVAGERHIIEGQIEISLPASYHVTPSEFAIHDDGTSFSGPINKKDMKQVISLYSDNVTVEEYLQYMISNEFSPDDENIGTEKIKRNLRSLTIRLINIVPDNKFDAEKLPTQLPVSEIRDMQDFCTQFAIGFKDRWGSGAFHLYDQKTEICHVINIYGAVIAVHIKRIETHYVVIEAIDWPIALLPDYIDSPAFNQSIKRNISKSKKHDRFKFDEATPREKFERYEKAANTNDAVKVLQSAKVIAK